MPRGPKGEKRPADVIGAAMASVVVRLGRLPLPTGMRRPPELDIVRRAYELWELSGKPEGRDQEFYLQALHELQAALNDRAPDHPE
jgi:hypothetical protein